MRSSLRALASLLLAWLLVSCTPAAVQLAAPPAHAVAISAAGARPWDVDRVALSSTTDWVIYTAPSWVRQVVVKNEHATASLNLGAFDETGAFDSANDDYWVIAAGASFTLTLSRGEPPTNSDHLNIPLASSTASHAAAFFLAESPE